MNQLLLKSGRIIDPASDTDQTGDVLICNGKITSISPTPISSQADTIDCEGLIIAPGLIDIHVHFREPSNNQHEETIRTGSNAAAMGGFTTVCTMPNTAPAIDTKKLIEETIAEGNRIGCCRILPTCCATLNRAGNELAPLDELCDSGAIAITDDGSVVENEEIMRQALQAAKKNNVPFMQHCQNPALSINGAMHAGHIQEELGVGAWPRIAEESIIERDIHLNLEIGASWHAQHLSSSRSVEIIRNAQQKGFPISGEVSPHHLLLTHEDCKSLGTQAKMNPPLREESDINAIKVGIEDGTIAILATDHAPHPWHTKNTTFQEASFGVIGLDCALPMYAKAIIEDGILDWPAMLAMMTINPANLIRRLDLGRIMEGGIADITIIDPVHSWIIDSNNFGSAGLNCPFDGWEATCKAIATIQGGTVVHQSISEHRIKDCNLNNLV